VALDLWFVESADERSELCGQTLDHRYRVLRRIGLGGTGVVFEAKCLQSASRVAIKTLRPCFVNHIDLGTRLRRELEVSRRVVHPGIVRFSDQGTLCDGTPYLVMPLLFGESLARLMARRRELQPGDVVVIASRVASILHAAHAAGYVHRDVKPEHILLNRTERGELSVHLLDFGVCSSGAAPADEKRRESGRVFGTPSYVSPEQAAGEVRIDGRADLFALGIVMFEALTGRLPFSASHVSKLLLRIIRDDAPRISEIAPHIDPGLDWIVSRLLARDPEQRVPSARALSRALLPYSGERYSTERRLAGLLNQSPLANDGVVTVEREAPAYAQPRVA
jgi:eukaryotic-like serine/threonine-protein kinase